MKAVQYRLELARPRQRADRRPFLPSSPAGPYRLPHDVRDRLVAALAAFRNRDAAFALAVFLARFWSMPGRVALPFVVDRVALADRPDLGLTEARVRGAIKTLEAVGFLTRWLTAGSPYRATEHGLRRKPVGFTFGADYMPAFLAANARAAAARGARPGERRSQAPDVRPRPSSASGGASLNSPERKSEAEPVVNSGEILPRLSPAAKKAIGMAEAGRTGARPGFAP